MLSCIDVAVGNIKNAAFLSPVPKRKQLQKTSHLPYIHSHARRVLNIMVAACLRKVDSTSVQGDVITNLNQTF